MINETKCILIDFNVNALSSFGMLMFIILSYWIFLGKNLVEYETFANDGA